MSKMDVGNNRVKERIHMYSLFHAILSFSLVRRGHLVFLCPETLRMVLKIEITKIGMGEKIRGKFDENGTVSYSSKGRKP